MTTTKKTAARKSSKKEITLAAIVAEAPANNCTALAIPSSHVQDGVLVGPPVPQGWAMVEAGTEVLEGEIIGPQEEITLSTDQTGIPEGHVKLRLPKGSKETALYIITPQFGKRPRWFEKKRLSHIHTEDGVYTISLAKREVKDRGLLHAVG